MVFGLKMMKTEQLCAESGLQSAMATLDWGRSWWFLLLPHTPCSLYLNSKSADWVFWVSLGSCADLTWQLVMPA